MSSHFLPQDRRPEVRTEVRVRANGTEGLLHFEFVQRLLHVAPATHRGSDGGGGARCAVRG